MINKYIKLPLMLEIEVKNYGLFTKNWNYNLKKGFNFFLGANTLGKTTSVYIILYGITGLPKENIDFFTKRSEKPDISKVPSVRLKLQINDNIIDMERNLQNSNIAHLSINGKTCGTTARNMEKIYEENIKEFTGFPSLEEYRFLLEKLFIREEEGNYLLWNFDDQARILRLLFGTDKLDKEFKDLEKQVTDYDSKWRGQKDTQAQFKKRLEVTKEQRKDTLQRLGSMKIDDLERNIKESEVKFKKLIQDKEDLIGKIKTQEQEKENISREISVGNSEKEELESEILNLENELFDSIYSDPKISLASHKLKNYRICMFCNHKLSVDVSQKIIDQIENTRCPVCKSVLPLKPKITMNKKKRKKVIVQLDQRRKRVSDLKKSIRRNNEDLQKVNENLKQYWEKNTEIENNISNITTEIDDFKLRLSDLKKGKIIQDMSVYDRDIQGLQIQIDFYENEVNKAKEKYKKTKKQLEKLNREFEKTLSVLKNDLTKIFNDYSKNFFNQCKLEIQHDKPSGSKIALPIFRPKINNVIRKDVDQISKSEGIFLEYVFRMSLCEVFNHITGNAINLMVETSEGVFDIGIIETIADLFVKFSNRNYYLIIISNLGRQDFLELLIKKSKLKDLSQRMVNFLEIGKLSKIQEDNLSKYRDLISALKSISSHRSKA